MALVLCPECGEETLEQLVNCPLCHEQLIDEEKKDRETHRRLVLFGLAFVGGLTSATLANVMGYATLALGLGAAGLAGMAALVVKLNATG